MSDRAKRIAQGNPPRRAAITARFAGSDALGVIADPSALSRLRCQKLGVFCCLIFDVANRLLGVLRPVGESEFAITFSERFSLRFLTGRKATRPPDCFIEGDLSEFTRTVDDVATHRR